MKRIAVFAAAWAVVALLPGGQAQTPNLALNTSVTRSSDVSSGRAPNAVDGDVNTFWQPLMSDRTDDLNVWLRVDLGAPAAIDKAVLNFRTPASRVDEFFVQASQDGATWQEVYRSVGGIAAIETALFASVTARFIRVDFTLNAGGTPNFQLNEFELYDTGGYPVSLSPRRASRARHRTASSGVQIHARSTSVELRCLRIFV